MEPSPDHPHAYFKRQSEPHDAILNRIKPPPWRDFTDPAKNQNERGALYIPREEEVALVNAAFQLRRPLLVTGKAGIGKSTLAHAVAHQLQLGEVLVWPITSRSTLQQGLYHYDAVARLQDASLQSQKSRHRRGKARPSAPDIGRYIRLGPLGTALLTSTKIKPRVLLIDEIDKSDIDLPNDLLHLFEEGEFEIPELSRLPEGAVYDEITVGLHKRESSTKSIKRGHVRCEDFPLVILTSNDEREFPPAFKRRCLRLEIKLPNEDELRQIVEKRVALNPEDNPKVTTLLKSFQSKLESGEMSTDQLLNAVYLVARDLSSEDAMVIKDVVLRPLNQ
ncbi:MoxR family ATPase [Verrucomicrobium sp. BvORR034]|uniref:AAA family ATPase n=1 Tax=Verrucomicrobium sp. BvORR034 TaxID=1396418 RepID=UPI000678780C|nr:MoxR family ATPase [Verrucomicrobium sp. BvORR034]